IVSDSKIKYCGKNYSYSHLLLLRISSILFIMYMPPRAKIDSWSTDNCCVKWSLKCGTVFIGLLSLAWCGLTAAWFYYLTVKCWEVDIRNCTMLDFDVDILLCIFGYILFVLLPSVTLSNNWRFLRKSRN
ncbi:hypothetical protein Avbf_12255, partial [Armadillidium vulgare]